MHLIPWDLDNAFANLVEGAPEATVTKIADRWGVTSNDCESFPFGPLGIPQRSAACDPIVAAAASLDADYQRIRDAIIAGPYSESAIDEVLDAWAAQIESAVIESDDAFDDAPTVEQWRLEIQRLKDAIGDERTR